MSLEISNLQKDGNASKEYLLLKATADINLSHYAVIDKTFDEDGNSSNVFRHFFRFPSVEVKQGEYVSLWTGKGSYEKGTLKSKEPVHRIYWGSDEAVWNDENRESATVLKVETVATIATGHPDPAKKKPVIRRVNQNPYKK